MSRAEIFVSIVAFAAFAVVIDSTLNHSAPAPRQDILHVPAGGCPAGYNLVAEVFTYRRYYQIMTAEEFEAKTAASLHVTVEEHRSTGRIAIPCHGCDYEKCEGWQWTSHERLDDKRRDHELGVGPSLNEDEQRAWDEIHSKPWNEAQTKRAIAHADERARAEAKVRRNDDRSVGDRIVDALNEVLEEDASARERERQESERGKKPTSPAIQRLMDEVRNDEPTNVGWCAEREGSQA